MTLPQLRFPLQDSPSSPPPQRSQPSASAKQQADAALAAARAKARLLEQEKEKAAAAAAARREPPTPPPPSPTPQPQAAAPPQGTPPAPPNTPPHRWLLPRLDPAAAAAANRQDANPQAAAPPLRAAQNTPAPRPWENVFPPPPAQGPSTAKPSVPTTPASAPRSTTTPTPDAPQKPIDPTLKTPATPSAATPPAATPPAATPPAATPPAATPPAATPSAAAPSAAGTLTPGPTQRGISANPRAANAVAINEAGKQKAAAAQLQAASRAGAVIQDGQTVPHPDGKGLLHHTGFALSTFHDSETAPHTRYRDNHGKQHKIYARDIRRITDPSGRTSYQFMVEGRPVSVPEDSNAPLFQIDDKNKRFTQAADGTRQDLGIDLNAAAKAGISPREKAAPGQTTEVDELDVIGHAMQRGIEKDGGWPYESLPPHLAEPIRLRDANTLFLQGEYPDVPVEDLRRNYDAYRDHYVSRHYDLPAGVDDKTFHHLNEQKLEQRKQVEGAAGAGVSSAMTGGMKLQAMAEWLKTHPDAGKNEKAAWGRTYDHVQSLLNPYRNAVHKALDGGEHEQDVLLDTLADLPELHREVLMRYAATVAKQRGKNHMLGVADTVGASAERTLTDMFTSVSRIPGSLKTQVEDGQTSFHGPITSMEQALQALSADLQDPRHNYYKGVQQADQLPLRPLSSEEKSIMQQTLQREKKRNGLALTMRSILNGAEPLNDSVLGKMAAGLGSSLPLVLATTPQGMLLAAGGYANADYHEIMAENPEMDERAAAKVALVSGGVKAGLDKLSLFGLGKLAPNVAKVLSGQATSQMVKKAALQAGATYGFENIQEGLQDLTRPAVQSLASSLGHDIQGVDWDREMKQFWGSRLDVALGVLPLTLLGIGHNTLQSRQAVLDILNNDQALKMAGIAENDRASILKAAQSGDATKSETLLQDAWKRRDPTVASAAIKETDEALHATTQHQSEPQDANSDQPQPPANNSQPEQTTPAAAQPSRPPLDLETSKKLITNVENIQKHRPLTPVEQADLDQARRVLAESQQSIPDNTTNGDPAPAKPSGPPLSVETSQALINNVMNRPPEQRAHPTTQADLAQAQNVLQDHVQKLESQEEPLSEAQQKELAEAKATLARVAPEANAQKPNGSNAQEDNNTDATKDVIPPKPQSLDPVRHQQHRNNLDRKGAEPRDAKAQAELQANDATLQHPETGVDATRKRIESTKFDKAENIGGKHINQADHLKSPAGVEVVHKPKAGQVKEKHRAGIEPETTGHREVAASKVAQALGIDLVPPTTMITHDGQPGSAQFFKKGMIDGKAASKPPYNVEIDPKTQTPVHLPDTVAEDWQLTDDLLMHSDRHKGNYMLQLKDGKIIEAALVDNGYCLPANTGVVEKRFPGPREGKPISPLNQERLRRMLDNEESLRKSLSSHLNEDALDGLFARAKALLARGTYGNFKIDEINAHLPPAKQRVESVSHDDYKQ